MSCVEGIDPSGRSPGGMYDAAVEALKEARTAGEKAIAQRAMRDAFNPAMSDPRAVACNHNLRPTESFAACVAGAGPKPGLRMVLGCQQNLSDGRVLVDGQVLPAGSHFEVVRYKPQSTDNDWSHGLCEIIFTKG